MIGLIEQKAGVQMRRSNPTQSVDSVKSSASDTVNKIGSVHADHLELFREVAKQVMLKFKDHEDAP